MQFDGPPQVVNRLVRFAASSSLYTSFVKVDGSFRHTGEGGIKHPGLSVHGLLFRFQVNLDRVRPRERTDGCVCSRIDYRRIDINRLAHGLEEIAAIDDDGVIASLERAKSKVAVAVGEHLQVAVTAAFQPDLEPCIGSLS